MTPIGLFTVPDAQLIADHMKRHRQTVRGERGRRQIARGKPLDFYSPFIVYVTMKAGVPGGVDTSGEFVVSTIATWAYHCTSPAGFSYRARTNDNDNNYDPGEPKRDTLTAPMQPEAQRVFGIEHEFARSGSAGWAFFNQHGDFILLSVNELPVMEDACP